MLLELWLWLLPELCMADSDEFKCNCVSISACGRCQSAVQTVTTDTSTVITLGALFHFSIQRLNQYVSCHFTIPADFPITNCSGEDSNGSSKIFEIYAMQILPLEQMLGNSRISTPEPRRGSNSAPGLEQHVSWGERVGTWAVLPAGKDWSKPCGELLHMSTLLQYHLFPHYSPVETYNAAKAALVMSPFICH